MTNLTSAKRPDHAAYGAALIVAAVFLMSLQDAIIKYASADIPLWQIYVLRSLIALPAFFGLARLDGKTTAILARSLGGWAMLRAAFLTLMYVSIYTAVPVLSLATIAAAFYTGPLFITLLSALLIGEPAGKLGWLAIGIGFIGILIIIRPGTDAFTALAFLPVLSGFFYACAAILTRARCQSEAPLTLAISLNLVLLFTGTLGSLAVTIWNPTAAQTSLYPFLFSHWIAPGFQDWFFLAILALLMIGIGYTLAGAYQAAPPVIIASFDYSYLIFASLWSYAIFSETPDTPTIAGMLLIAIAGLLAVRHRP